MYNIKVNFNHHYPMAILNSLITESTRLGYTVSKNNSIPVNSIYVNDKPVGYVVYEDAFHFGDHHIKNMNANDYKKIFKFHYSPNIIDYSNLPINPKYLDRIVPGGLWRCWETQPKYLGWDKQDLLTRSRNIDIVSTMRYTNSGTPKDPKNWPEWSHVRKNLMEQTHQLRTEGYKTVYEMKPRDVYVNQILKNTKLGFIWSASSYLGWKIPEFIQEGVIMITEPLGKDYMLCNDVAIEDGVHCIFEKNPKHFSDVAKELLKDTATMQKIKSNCLDLWESKLSRPSVGEWYFNQLVEGYTKN
jgi:hypothetical protein